MKSLNINMFFLNIYTPILCKKNVTNYCYVFKTILFQNYFLVGLRLINKVIKSDHQALGEEGVGEVFFAASLTNK